MSEKILCARCGKYCTGKYIYMSDIDTELICKDCWDKEQPKELIKRIAELEEENAKLQDRLKNAIVTKFRVNDCVYIVRCFTGEIKKCLIHSINIELTTTPKIHYNIINMKDWEEINDLGFLPNKNYLLDTAIESNVFATEAEAQKYLEERK